MYTAHTFLDDCDGSFDEGCPSEAGAGSELNAGGEAGGENDREENDDEITVIVGGDEADDELMVGQVMDQENSVEDTRSPLLTSGCQAQGRIGSRLGLCIFILWLSVGIRIRKYKLRRVFRAVV